MMQSIFVKADGDNTQLHSQARRKARRAWQLPNISSNKKLEGKMRVSIVFLVLILIMNLSATIINIPEDYPSIQEGINASVDTDTILVQPGNYVENINYNGKNITIASLFLTTQDTSYISQTTIDGNQNGTVVTFESGENSTAVLTGFTITNGDGVPYGGGIECVDSSPCLKYLIVTNNSGGMGGGILCWNNSDPILSNITITGNNSYYGGGICCYENCNPIIENVTITNNSVIDHGGGICCLSSSPSLENVTIISNSANMYYSAGGGIYCDDNSNLIVTNVIIANNSTFNNGGGIYCDDNSNVILENVSIVGNSAFNDGGGIYCEENNLNFNVENRCNIFLNFAARKGNDLYSVETLNVIVDTFTIINPTEYFASPIDNFTFDILHSKIEQVNQDLYVNPNGSDDNNGLTPEQPLLTISNALAKIIADSTNTRTIHLSNGVYSPSQTGEKFPLNCKNHVSLKGNNEEFSILDGDNQSGIIFCYLDNNFSIEDMTIQNGYAYSGGGIHCSHSNPSLINLTIKDNSANCEDSGGGGIFCSHSNPSMLNLTITNNSVLGAYSYGGGILFICSNSNLENIIINDNNSDYGGGICCFDKSNLSLLNVAIRNNNAYKGGGICCWDNCSPSLEYVQIINNSAGYGGAIYLYRSSPTLENVTITVNPAIHDGGGIYCRDNSNPSLNNCIMWNDLPQEIYFSGFSEYNSITVSYSDIHGGEEAIETNNNGTVYWEEGNIDSDPLFVDATNGDYHLTEFSPCIDTGDPNSPLDPDGTIADMGAFYYDQSVSVQDEIIQSSILNKLSNYPNPFNPSTTIKFSIQNDSNVELTIYNIKGQKIKALAQDEFAKGSHSVIWNGDNESGQPISSGVYLYKLIINGKTESMKKCLLLK